MKNTFSANILPLIYIYIYPIIADFENFTIFQSADKKVFLYIFFKKQGVPRNVTVGE